MSYEILSAKLSQLDREFEQFHANIRFSETESHGQLSQKLAHLRQKNETDRLVFQTKLKFSCSPMVEKRVSSYETIEDFIDRERAQQNGSFSEVWRQGLSTEELLLLAEYCFSSWKQLVHKI